MKTMTFRITTSGDDEQLHNNKIAEIKTALSAIHGLSAFITETGTSEPPIKDSTVFSDVFIQKHNHSLTWIDICAATSTKSHTSRPNQFTFVNARPIGKSQITTPNRRA